MGSVSTEGESRKEEHNPSMKQTLLFAVLLSCILQALLHRHVRMEETALWQLKICSI